MHTLDYMTSRDKVDVDTWHKGIQNTQEKLGRSKFGFARTAVSHFESKRHEGSGNEIVHYYRALCHGADQKACGLWEWDWKIVQTSGSYFGFLGNWLSELNQQPFTQAHLTQAHFDSKKGLKSLDKCTFFHKWDQSSMSRTAMDDSELQTALQEC